MYSIYEKCADGITRKKCLKTLLDEIISVNPRTPVEYNSPHRNLMMVKRAKSLRADLTEAALSDCVQDIVFDPYGLTIYVW